MIAQTKYVAPLAALQLSFWVLSASVPTVAHAEDVGREWRVQPAVSVKGVSNAYVNEGILTIDEIVSVMIELRTSTTTKPYYISVFPEYNYSTHAHMSNSVNLGWLFKYTSGPWDTTGSLFVHRNTGGKNTWLYAGRIRYQVDARYKVGIEIIDALRKPDSPRLALGYYRSLSRSLSLNIIAAKGIGEDSAASARVELSWAL